MTKTVVRRCYCPQVLRKHWKVTSPDGYVTYWGKWERAMLRATKGW